MSRFGVSEVIRPLSLNKIVAEKEIYLGLTKVKIDKVANSCIPEDKQRVVAEILKAIEQAYAGNSDYTCIELFTRENGEHKGVARVNVCYMRRVD